MDKVDVGLWISYILIGFAVAAAVIMPLINAISSPKQLMKTMIGLAGLFVIFGIAYALSGDEVTAGYAKRGIDAGLSKFVGGGLTMMYLMFGLSIVGILYSEISKVFK